jgi:hypothetical protein
VQTGRRKKKCCGWVEPVAGCGWKRRGKKRGSGRPMSSRPNPTHYSGHYFLIFSCGSCSDGFDFLIFSDGSCFLDFFFFFFFTGSCDFPTTFRVIKSQKGLTFPSRF